MFSSSILYQKNGKTIQFLKKQSNNNKKFHVRVAQSRCTIIYQNNRYTFKGFIKPQKPSKSDYPDRKNWEAKLLEWKKKCEEYVLFDSYDLKNIKKCITEYEVWICNVKKCNKKIILDTKLVHILDHWNCSHLHHHDNTVTPDQVKEMELNSMLHDEVISNPSMSLSTVYQTFSNTHFPTLQNNQLLPPTYNPTMKTRLKRMRKNNNLVRSNDIENQVKHHQKHKFKAMNNSLDGLQYNPYKDVNIHDYNLNSKTKKELKEFIDKHGNNMQKLREKATLTASNQLNAQEENRLIQNFIKSKDPNLDLKTIIIDDCALQGYEIMIHYSIGGLKMMDKSQCRIIGFDGTFRMSPKMELWKNLLKNKTYAQVNIYLIHIYAFSSPFFCFHLNFSFSCTLVGLFIFFLFFILSFCYHICYFMMNRFGFGMLLKLMQMI